MSALLRLLTNLPAWSEQAACRTADPELFFTADGERGSQARRDSTTTAKAVCATCQVRAECLTYAISPGTRQDYGVWGGLDQDERASLVRRTNRRKEAVR